MYGPTGKIAKTANGLTDYYHTDHLRSTRLITDESGTIVTEVQYKHFGESVTTGEESYLYTGKQKDVTGLYYYGARYYSAEIGRFITRDQNLGRIFNPKTLNRYTYCANNPLKYIDLNGRDYFLPEWSYHEEPDFGIDYSAKGLFLWLNLWFQRAATKNMATYGGWIREQERTNTYAGIFGVATGGTIATITLGTALGFVGALAIGIVFYELGVSSEFYYDLWVSDPKFAELYTTAEMYADLLYWGVDCEQEAVDAFVELTVYMLQQKYGDDWRKFARASILSHYDEMMKRKQSQPSDDQKSSSSGISTPPQFDERKTPD